MFDYATIQAQWSAYPPIRLAYGEDETGYGRVLNATHVCIATLPLTGGSMLYDIVTHAGILGDAGHEAGAGILGAECHVYAIGGGVGEELGAQSGQGDGHGCLHHVRAHDTGRRLAEG